MSDNSCVSCETWVREAFEPRLEATHVQPDETRVEGELIDQLQALLAPSRSVASLSGPWRMELTLSFKMTSLPDISLRVSKPIAVVLTLGGDIWTAEQRDFMLCATGDTPQEAWQSLAEYISEDFAHWSRTPADQLSDDAKALITKFREHISLVTA